MLPCKGFLISLHNASCHGSIQVETVETRSQGCSNDIYGCCPVACTITRNCNQINYSIGSKPGCANTLASGIVDERVSISMIELSAV